MMREAQKMMADPAFQERMKTVTENQAFKTSMENTNEMMKDKDKAQKLKHPLPSSLQEKEI